jgi:hypothetical protein
MMRMLQSRRGDWIQIILVLSFVILLCFAIALLTIESKKLRIERPQLQQDLLDAKASATLISLLRTKTADGSTVADLIIIENQNALRNEVTLQDVHFTVTYPGGSGTQGECTTTTVGTNSRSGGQQFTTCSTRNVDICTSTKCTTQSNSRSNPGEQTKGNYGAASTLLPGNDGNIQIRLEVFS